MIVSKGKIERFKHEDGDIGIRFIASNSEPIWTTQGYKNKAYSKKLARILAAAYNCDYVDLTGKVAITYTAKRP